MVQFRGFNTIGQNKKFSLTDFNLIKRDVLNALTIRQGELPGRPEVGSTMWNYIFEGMTKENLQSMRAEVRKTIEKDPRVRLVTANFHPAEHGVLVELFVQVINTTEQQRIAAFFDSDTQQVTSYDL
tara:strand:+ start:3621 stop:4001 length:381 start_codon:yes stop_codon:yes gene_type:complete